MGRWGCYQNSNGQGCQCDMQMEQTDWTNVTPCGSVAIRGMAED